MKIRIVKILSYLFLAASYILGAEGIGKELIQVEIIKIYDGDTVRVKKPCGDEVSVRLIGIDCFETSAINRAYKQAYLQKITIEEVIRRGKESKRILKDFFKNNNNNIYLEEFGIDKYGRTLGIIYSEKLNINNYMRHQGKCLKYIYKEKKKFYDNQF